MRTILGTIRPLAAAALVAAGLPGTLSAQDNDNFVAYNALVLTTTGGLAPLVIPDLVAGAGGAHLALRAGFISPWGSDDDRFTNLVATLQVPLGRSAALGLTAGALNSDCDGCDMELMLGLSANGQLVRLPLGAERNAPALSVGLEAEGGWADIDIGGGRKLTALSGSLGVPLALSGGSGGLRLALVATPGYGYGRISVFDDTESGTRPLLGLGAALSTGGVSLNLGMRKVFVADGRALFGGSVAFRLGRPAP